jgi:hypothetical protein
MANKKNRKRENRREKREEKDNQKKEIPSKKAKEKKKEALENVILMGAPEVKKEISPKELKKQVPLEGVDTSHTKAEEKKPIEITNNVVHNTAPKAMNLGRVFFAITAILLVYLGVGSALNWFGPLDIKFLSLWPLILIFIGLLLFRVKTLSGKILGSIVVVVVLFASLSVLVRGGDIFHIELSDDVVSETREVEMFEKIVFEGVGDIEITQGETQSLEIEGDSNILEQIITETKDGTLRISHKSSLWNLFQFDSAKVSVKLVSPKISGLHIIGIGDINGSNLEGESLGVSISGSGDVDLKQVRFDEIDSRIIGNGDITISGQTIVQVVSISGSGSYNGEKLSSTEAGVRISGSGDVFVDVKELLDVSITGSGDVKYSGSPELREGKVSGSGSILKQDEDSVGELDPKEFYEKVKPVF